MMLVNLVRREISPGPDGDDVSESIRLWERLDLLIVSDGDWGLVFLSRNGGFMVISLELV